MRRKKNSGTMMSINAIEINGLIELAKTISKQLGRGSNRWYPVTQIDCPNSVMVNYGLDIGLRDEIEDTMGYLFKHRTCNDGVFTIDVIEPDDPYDRCICMTFCHSLAMQMFMKGYDGGACYGEA